MATALDIVTDALMRLQVYAEGQPLTDADAERGLSVLNDMIDSWSNESLTCYEITEQTALLQVGVASYTIGTGGVFNMTRPLKLIDGPGAAYIQDSSQNNYPMAVVQRAEWNMIGLRTVNSDIPDTIFYDPQYPLGIINIFPVPTISYSIFFDSYLQLSELTSLSSILSLPLGYKMALQTNLAVELFPYFKEGNINPILVESASKHKGNIKRTNSRPVIAVYDPEIISRSTPTYNIYRDSGG